LSFNEPVELADRRVSLKRKIERREAVWWIPAPTVGACPYPRQGMMILGDMSKCSAMKRHGFDGIDSNQELGIDHAG
jgi:hypothetical protein